MGIYMSATAIIGVKFTPSEPIVTESFIRGCEHAGSDGKFCSECGAPIWKDRTTYEQQFEDIHEDFMEPVLERLDDLFDGHAVVEGDYDWNNFYIGYGATCDNFEEAMTPIINHEHIFSKLASVLVEFGVWEQCKDSFGLWTISTGH